MITSVFSVKNSFWSKIGFLSRMNFWRIFYYSAKQNWAPVEHRLTTVSKQVKTIVPLNSKHEKRSSTPLKPQSTTQKILLSFTLISAKSIPLSFMRFLTKYFINFNTFFPQISENFHREFGSRNYNADWSISEKIIERFRNI